MRKLFVILTIGLLVGAGVYFAPLFWGAWRTAYTELVFPENTYVYLFLHNLEEARENLHNTVIWQEINRSPRKKTYEQQRDRAISLIENFTGVDPKPLFKQFSKELALGFFPVSATQSSFAFVGYVDSESEVKKIFDQTIDPSLKRKIPDLVKSTQTYSGVTYYKYNSSQFNNKVSPTFCLDDHRLIIGSSEQGLKLLIDVKNKKSPSLKSSKLFKKSKDKISYRRGLLLYLNAESAFNLFRNSIEKKNQRLWLGIVRVSGIEAFESFSYRVSVKKDGFEESGFVSVKPSRRGLLKIYLDQPPDKIESVSSVPRDAKIFSAGTLADFARMWDDINNQLREILSASEYEKWQRAVDFLRGVLNFDIRRDVFEPLGNQFCFSYEAASGVESDPTKMKYLLALQLKKPDKFQETLERIVSLASMRGVQRVKETYKGRNISILRVNMGQFSASPSYYISNPWFHFSTHSDLLKKSIDALDSKQSIETLPDYQKLTSQFPEKLNAISYTNVQSYLQMYATILSREANSPENQWLRESGVQEELASLAKKLYGSASYSRNATDGIHIYSYSSIPTSFLGFPAIVAALPRIMQGYGPQSNL